MADPTTRRDDGTRARRRPDNGPWFGWDPVLNAWRLILRAPGPAGCVPLPHAGGLLLADAVDGTVVEAVVDTETGAPGGHLTPGAVQLWRRLFGLPMADMLEQSGPKHTRWRFGPVDAELAAERRRAGRLAIVEATRNPSRPSVAAVEAANLGAALGMSSADADADSVACADLLDDRTLQLLANDGLAEPFADVLIRNGAAADELPDPLRVDTGTLSAPATELPVGDTRGLAERIAERLSNWTRPAQRPLLPPMPALRSNSFLSASDAIGMISSARASEATAPERRIRVELGDVPADRLLDWDAASNGDRFAARVTFRGSAVPHLEAQLVTSEAASPVATTFLMESMGGGRVSLRAEFPPAAARTAVSDPAAVVQIVAIDLSPAASFDRAPVTPAGHATAITRSAAAAGRRALAAANGRAEGSLAALRWTAQQWKVAAHAWRTADDSERHDACASVASAFDQVIAAFADGDDTTSAVDTLETELGVGWSDRATQLLEEELIRIWSLRGDSADPLDVPALERAARLADVLGDDFAATDILVTLARQSGLTDERLRSVVRRALSHAALAGRIDDPSVSTVASLIDTPPSRPRGEAVPPPDDHEEHS